jgi:hypothetical protein
MKKLINETYKSREQDERQEIEKEYKLYLQNEIEEGIKRQNERTKLSDYHKSQ